jgi:hypothetical protein
MSFFRGPKDESLTGPCLGCVVGGATQSSAVLWCDSGRHYGERNNHKFWGVRFYPAETQEPNAASLTTKENVRYPSLVWKRKTAHQFANNRNTCLSPKRVHLGCLPFRRDWALVGTTLQRRWLKLRLFLLRLPFPHLIRPGEAERASGYPSRRAMKGRWTWGVQACWLDTFHPTESITARGDNRSREPSCRGLCRVDSPSSINGLLPPNRGKSSKSCPKNSDSVHSRG